jgi:hypothetical protein
LERGYLCNEVAEPALSVKLKSAKAYGQNSGSEEEGVSSENSTVTRAYENPGFGISLQYPEGWDTRELRNDPSIDTNNSIVAYFRAPVQSPNDPYEENVIVGVQKFPFNNVTLEKYTRDSINTFRNQSDGIRIVQSSPTTLAGNPAHELVFAEGNLRKMQIWTVVDNNTACVLMYNAEDSQFPNFLPQATQIINSFQINAPATASASAPLY